MRLCHKKFYPASPFRKICSKLVEVFGKAVGRRLKKVSCGGATFRRYRPLPWLNLQARTFVPVDIRLRIINYTLLPERNGFCSIGSGAVESGVKQIDRRTKNFWGTVEGWWGTTNLNCAVLTISNGILAIWCFAKRDAPRLSSVRTEGTTNSLFCNKTTDQSAQVIKGVALLITSFWKLFQKLAAELKPFRADFAKYRVVLLGWPLFPKRFLAHNTTGHLTNHRRSQWINFLLNFESSWTPLVHSWLS